MKFSLCLITLFILLSCKEEPQLPNANLPKKEIPEVIESESILDTVYQEVVVTEFDSIPTESDTTFLIDGVPHTLHVSIKLNGKKKIQFDEKPVEKNGKMWVYRYIGRDMIYDFHLTNPKKQTIWKKRLTKESYLDELGSLVVESNMYTPQFKTYLSTTKQLVLTQDFWVTDSDVGVQGILFFDQKGNTDIKFHCWYASSGSECDVVYAPDSSFLLTCSEIISPNGKRTKITRNDAYLAGNMTIGNRHVLVSYAPVKDTSFIGGRLYNQHGKIVKEFEFEGYGGALGYTLPRKYLKKFGRYYFVDEHNKFVLMIPEKNPTAFKKYPFAKLRHDPSGLDLDTVLILQKEVNDHRFGIDSLGEVRTYQVGDFTGTWKYFDETD